MTVSPFDSALYGLHFGDAELGRLFSDAEDVRRMVLFERVLARVEGRLGVIPTDAGIAIDRDLDGVVPDMGRLAQGVTSAGVPVPALVAALRQGLHKDHGQWVHWGATSQDVIDTAHTIGLAEAIPVLEARLGALIDALSHKSQGYADTVMAGRTRGQVATPITFGLRIAQWAQPLIAFEAELATVSASVLKVQFGGASGANTAIAPHGHAVAKAMADELGLRYAPPWHTDRSGVLSLAGWLLRLAVALSKMAGDLILMQRSEIAEARAGTGGGSSTMPQKSNPVGAETIRVLATMAQAYHAGLVQAAPQAEERDGTGWPVEWVFLPQLVVAVGAALRYGHELATTLEALPDGMAKTLDRSTGVMAEQASFILAKHMPRADAQALVKEAAASGRPLAEALAELSDIDVDWSLRLQPSSAIQSSKAIAQAIFIARGDRD